MRRVKYKQHVQDPETKRWTMKEMGEADFFEFGVNYEELDGGPGNYTSAIIETDDGHILNLPVENIQFI